MAVPDLSKRNQWRLHAGLDHGSEHKRQGVRERLVLSRRHGTKGEIVFGYLPLGRAKPYQWGDVWTPRAKSNAESEFQ